MTEKSNDLKDLVEKRKREKKKNPKFRRQESWRYKRLKENWRRPKGLDNKMRKKVKGWPQSPNIGYGGPKKSRGLHPSSLKEIIVFNVDDLETIRPDVEAIRIGHTVSKRKRIEIINKAKEKGIYVLNPGEFRELEKPVVEKQTS
ncbi:MAG: 50S ribosomal protein L32e [Nitrososphaerota archaeon]|nr:50S ribosomal protein L32e [Candidatus Bathyarchaeota archaeon]MDW8048284.1 50S ribosomal protein L32e [Nitrososphaerota archaeon]